MEQDRSKERSSEHDEMTEESFVKGLYTFMKQRDTPIERIPHLGFKQIDLFLMYKTVKDLGGYQQVTAQQLWKKVYNILGGNPRSTSAATCTRRHYEKLLLPFECHQTGYGDDIVFRTPRIQKRFHPSSYGEFEHEYPRSVKRVDFRHIPAFPQTSPNMFVDHQRQMFSLPLNIAPYFSHSSTSPPNYIPYRDSMLSHLQDQPPRAPAPYLGEPSAEVTRECKQPLDWLRYLAKEYKSSAGWEEPLNLSQKDNKLDTPSDAPSSFGPPSSKKPKFLNEASPLYPPRGPTKEEEADQAETVEKTSKGEVLASVLAGPSPVSADIIDLTSSSSANLVPRRASPPSVHLFSRRPNYYESPAMRREDDLHPDGQREESSSMHAPNSGLRSNLTGHQALDSNNNMEIQIPLKLLQELIRRGLLSSPALFGHRQEPPKSDTPPEPKLNVRSHSGTSESSTTSKEPEDLSLRSSQRNHFDTSHQDSSMKRQRSFGSTEELKPPSVISSFHINSPVRLSLDRNTSKPADPNPVHVSVTKNQEHTSPRSPRYSEDAPIPLTMKFGTKPENLTTSPIMKKEISSSPPLLQVTDHLKFLLANLPYRLERRPTF